MVNAYRGGFVTVDKTRRAILAGAPALGALALAACSKPASAESDGSAHLGAAKTVAWAVGTTGSDFVLEISLGAADAAEMLGWRFNRILNPAPTPDAHINAIRQAVTSRADVVITVDWYQAVVDEIALGQKKGVAFAVVNSANNPDTLAPLNVPFVGQQPYDNGRLMGERIGRALLERGVTMGTVLAGNPFPGSLNLEQRIQGVAEGLAASGATGLKLVSFADNSASDAAASVALYKAKITEIGDVVAHAAAGGEMSAIPLTKALSENGTKGKALIGGWISSLKVLNLIKAGEMDFAIDENLYFQGFMAVMLAWSMVERGMPAVTLSSGHAWVTPENVEAIIGSYAKRKSAAGAYGLS